MEPVESPRSTPELAKEYPLILITGGRILGYFHTQFRQIEKLRRMHPDPLLQIHPKTAAKLGVKPGDWVWIETPVGRCKQRVFLFDGIDPRVVHAELGWWFPEKPGADPDLHGAWESNINVVISDEPSHLDPGFGGPTMRGLLWKVYRAE